MRERAAFFLRSVAYPVKRKLCWLHPSKLVTSGSGRNAALCATRSDQSKEDARVSSHREKAPQDRAAARALRWSDSSECDRCLWAHNQACIGDALLRPPGHKHAKEPA